MLNNLYPEGFHAPHAVRLVEADFYKFTPQQRYDVVICNQVLEHVPDPAAFAAKLLSIGKVVIASVPHNWPRGPPGHLHHRINQTQLLAWFGTPRYSEVGIVQETHREAKSNPQFMQRLVVVVDTRVKGNNATIGLE
jgi:trans-aconitate methyltransferase